MFVPDPLDRLRGHYSFNGVMIMIALAVLQLSPLLRLTFPNLIRYGSYDTFPGAAIVSCDSLAAVVVLVSIFLL